MTKMKRAALALTLTVAALTGGLMLEAASAPDAAACCRLR